MLASPVPTMFRPDHRGYHALYRPNEVNRCPGCGRSHWIVGRMLAECGFCATALPLAGNADLQEGLSLPAYH